MENSHERFLALSEVLVSYSMGDFDAKAPISDQLDEIDTIISGVNMLGEELKETTISRDFFSSIYNAVAEILLIIDTEGIIEDANSTAQHTLGVPLNTLKGTSLNSWLPADEVSTFATIQSKLEKRKSFAFESWLRTKDTETEVYCRCSKRVSRSGEVSGYLIIAEDITERKESEKRVMRAVMSTQEQVQKRVAKDLHDAMGTHLSMVSMLLQSIINLDQELDPNAKEIVENCREWVEKSIKQIREICFDMLPGELEKENIVKALQVFVKKMNEQQQVRFEFGCNGKLPKLPKQIEKALYRVAQEFSNNALKHSDANTVQLSLVIGPQDIKLILMDDGKGFDASTLTPEKRGSGIYTMQSRIEAFGGDFSLTSQLETGTKAVITLQRKNAKLKADE